MKDWLGISRHVCVVTGACGGLGMAITRAFLEADARVLMVDLPRNTECNSVPGQLAEFAPNVAFAAGGCQRRLLGRRVFHQV